MENQIDNNVVEIEPEEVLETHSEMDEKALLAELNGEDFDPETVLKRKDPKKAAALEAGKATAGAVLGVTEQVLKQFGHKEFTFDPEQAEGVVNAAAPLFVKYGGELPPWLSAYKEELTFIVAAGALSVNSVGQIRSLKAIDKAKEIEQSESEPKEETEYETE